LGLIGGGLGLYVIMNYVQKKQAAKEAAEDAAKGHHHHHHRHRHRHKVVKKS
jgi:ABC-type nickel/cobalt efflux system permease component RcnA